MAEQMKTSGIDWIGEIPCSWNIKRIKYLAQLKGRIGWQGLTSDEYTDVGPFLITGVDFSDGSINWESCVHITEERWAEAPEIHIKNGDLLITKDGTVGKVAIVENLQGKASLNSGVLLIKASDGYNKKFLYAVIDFKHYFTVPMTYLIAHKKDRILHLDDLFAEQVTLKFSTYLARVAIP